MQDPTPAQLATLDPQMQRRAVELINALRAVGVPAAIVAGGARRSLAEQTKLYQSGTGVTSTVRSRHVVGMAFDLDVLGMNRNDIPRWFWDIVGPWAEERLGLRWGGRWSRPYDPGHFEL